jgi:hypothetical protein
LTVEQTILADSDAPTAARYFNALVDAGDHCSTYDKVVTSGRDLPLP